LPELSKEKVCSPGRGIQFYAPPVYVDIGGLGAGLRQLFNYSAQVDQASENVKNAHAGQGIYLVRTGYTDPVGAAPGVTFHGEAVVGVITSLHRKQLPEREGISLNLKSMGYIMIQVSKNHTGLI
jgi:hypothetical protein